MVPFKNQSPVRGFARTISYAILKGKNTKETVYLTAKMVLSKELYDRNLI